MAQTDGASGAGGCAVRVDFTLDGSPGSPACPDPGNLGVVYSLVSASVLALDLTRHPSGARLADLVDSALLLDEPTLAALREAAAALPDRQPARRRLLTVAQHQPSMADGLAGVSAGLRAEQPSLVASAALAGRLLGRLPHLHAMLLQEGPLAEAEPLAVGTVLDAVTATWCAADPSAQLDDLEALHAPWHAAVPPFPAPLPVAVPAGASASLLQLLDRVASSTPAQWRELAHANDASYGGLGWSETLHLACLATAETDRVLDVARWLLAASRTASTTDHATDGVAPGAMMAVVSAVQATCVRDVLPAETVATMTGPCRAVLGWSG